MIKLRYNQDPKEGNMREILFKAILGSSFIGMILMNFLANSIPFNNKTTGAISDTYSTYFTPAGITFAIWSVIYIMLGIATFTLIKMEFSETTKYIMITFSILAVFNSLWLVTWHYERLFLSVIVMLIMLGLLITGYILSKEMSIVHSSMSIYMGWISIATIANISIWITSKDLPLFMNSERMWFYIILFIGLVLVTTVLFFTKDLIYGSVFAWAYFGILLRHLSNQGKYLENTTYLTLMFILVTVVLIGNITIKFIQK